MKKKTTENVLKLKLLVLIKGCLVEGIRGDFGEFKFKIMLKKIGENPNMLIKILEKLGKFLIQMLEFQ